MKLWTISRKKVLFQTRFGTTSLFYTLLYSTHSPTWKLSAFLTFVDVVVQNSISAFDFHFHKLKLKLRLFSCLLIFFNEFPVHWLCPFFYWGKIHIFLFNLQNLCILGVNSLRIHVCKCVYAHESVYIYFFLLFYLIRY